MLPALSILKKIYEDLDMVLYAMLSMSKEFFPKDEENQINIKMPDDVSLAELSEYISEIDCVFNKMQAMRKINENHDFTLKRVDSGSAWLIVAVSVPAAIVTIGAIVKLVMDVKRRLIEDNTYEAKVACVEIRG
jgi:hypothetical protein